MGNRFLYSGILLVLVSGCFGSSDQVLQSDLISKEIGLAVINNSSSSSNPEFRVTGLVEGDTFILYRDADEECKKGIIVGQGSKPANASHVDLKVANFGHAFRDANESERSYDYRVLIRHADQKTTCTQLASATVKFPSNISKISGIDVYSLCFLTANGEVFCKGRNLVQNSGSGSGFAGFTKVEGLSSVKDLSVHFNSACVLLQTGKIKCWGAGSFKKLGTGFTGVNYVPIEVPGLEGVISLDVGYQNVCAVVSSNQAYCWGENFGPAPKLITDSVTQVSVGLTHACARKTNGQVFCWGRNSWSQLGNGGTTAAPDGVFVSGINNAVEVSVGDTHSCARLSDNKVKCWGYGILGNGTDGYVFTPALVTGLTGVISLHSGQKAICAVMSTGQVKCWGANTIGELGDGTLTERLTPVTVSGITNAKQVVSLDGETCAVLSNGRVGCWSMIPKPDLMTMSNFKDISYVKDVTTANDVSVSRTHACFTGPGKFCWGQNSYGQFGNGTGLIRNYHDEPVFSGNATINLSMGTNFSCEIQNSGSWSKNVYCRGINNSGQMANGLINDLNYTEVIFNNSDATQVASGFYHACLLNRIGGVSCWGGNSYGQVGDGTTVVKSKPVTVAGLGKAIRISSGAYHSCAVLENGSVKCWGKNDRRQLGDGTATNRSTPVTVQGLTDVVDIAGGSDHQCALLKNGTVTCWGDNKVKPVSVSGLSGVTGISLGDDHSCALIQDGSVYCWGSDYGDEPVRINGLAGAIKLSSGGSTTCAVTASGTIGCWGSNENALRGHPMPALRVLFQN